MTTGHGWWVPGPGFLLLSRRDVCPAARRGETGETAQSGGTRTIPERSEGAVASGEQVVVMAAGGCCCGSHRAAARGLTAG